MPHRIALVVALISLISSGQTAGRWTRVADMPAARAAHAVVATTSAVYVLGGTGGRGEPVLELDRFDGSRWTRVGAIPGEGLNAPAAAGAGDAIYLIGGFGTTTNRPTAAVHRYDTRRRVWTAAAPLPAPRGGHAAIVFDGRIHVIGGGNAMSTIDDHSVYDPSTNSWNERAKLPRSMGSPALAVVAGELYSVGGRSGPNDFGDVHIYDPKTDAWRPGPAIPARGTGGAVAHRGALYYFGGELQARRAVLPDVLFLAPGAGEWSVISALPTPRNFARAVTFKGAVYIVGGSMAYGSSHSSIGSAVVERFDPPR
jgi:N-acetylneuraminic acid mutarotase